MKGQGKRGWLLAVICTLVAGCFLLTQERPGSNPRSGPEEPHRDWLRTAGFFHIPPWPTLKQATAAEFAQVPTQGNLAGQFPHLRGEALDRASREVSRCLNQAAIALPGKEWDVLLIRPENAAIIAAWHPSLVRAQEDGFVKLALIQAVLRWQLSHQYQLDLRYRNCRDFEEWRALQAVVEGRVLAETRKQAQDLGLEEYFPLLTERLMYVPEVSPDTALRTFCQAALRQLHWSSVQGLAFWDHLARQGPSEAEVFARPPRLPEWIERPELYLRCLRESRSDLAAELTRLEPALPADSWQVRQQPWTPEMVRQVASLLNEEKRADRILAGWEEGRSLVWQHNNHPGQCIALSLARCESPAAARRCFDFVLELHRRRDDLTRNPCGLSLKVVESRSRGMSLPGAEEAVYLDKKVQPAQGGPAIPLSLLLARAQEKVIEITWHGLTGDPGWAEKTVASLQP